MNASLIQLPGDYGPRIGAWLCEASAPCRGSVVVVQEIYGANSHIREVLVDYASAGFTALAPCFFDHIERGIELNYDADGTQRGREMVAQLGVDTPLRHVAAAAEYLAGDNGVGVVGYCWGGAIAYLSATRLGLPAVSYYGRLVEQYLHEKPQAALQFHFGELDELIPMSSVDRVGAANPRSELYTYPAGHAFNRVGDSHGHAPSAQLARQRAHSFFAQQLATRQ